MYCPTSGQTKYPPLCAANAPGLIVGRDMQIRYSVLVA
jgi:hypothetical protein